MEKKSQQRKANFNVMQTILEIDSVLEFSNIIILNCLGSNLFAKPEAEHKSLTMQQMGSKLFAKPKRNNRPSEEKIYPKSIKETVDRLKILADYLNVTSLQAALFCAFFSKCVSHSGSADLDDIKRYFVLSGLNLLCLEKDIKTLEEKNLISSRYERGYLNYEIDNEVREAIIQNLKVSKSRHKKEISQYDLVNYISDLIDQRSEDYFNSQYLFSLVYDQECKYSYLLFLNEVKKLIPKIEDRILFYKLCNDYINECSRKSSIMKTLSDIHRNVSTCMSIMNELSKENHILQESNLVQVLPNIMLSESEMELTEKGKELFLDKDYNLFIEKGKNEGLIYPDNIKIKQLFYDENLQNQISSLRQNLTNEQFVRLQTRLSEKALPKGIAAIFYGKPGTGKTETALQLAKATGRAIMQVDISATKSCWFGESEKIIKKVFSSYKDLCNKEEIKPILLFNEADAVFSKRKEINDSNVAQTENAIQNIILEEMEKLDGILIATTNLADNLDAAFERRFLFKLYFNNPTTEAKQTIWQSKLTWLSNEESRHLASMYNFSGGEIDNIVRKTLMDELLTNERPTLSYIEQLCRNEKLQNHHRKLGF